MAVAADALMSIMLAALGAQVMASGEIHSRGDDPVYASMQQNALGTKMAELISLTNQEMALEKTSGTDVANLSSTKTEKEGQLDHVVLLLEEKKSARDRLSKEISKFAEEVEQIKKDYDNLMRRTEILGSQ